METAQTGFAYKSPSAHKFWFLPKKSLFIHSFSPIQATVPQPLVVP